MKSLRKITGRVEVYVGLVLVALCLFIIYPFYTILTKSVFSSKVEGMTLYNFERFFSKKYYYRTLIRSMVICSSTMVFSCILGVFIAPPRRPPSTAGRAPGARR
mgnify:CR=1 FL=1